MNTPTAQQRGKLEIRNSKFEIPPTHSFPEARLTFDLPMTPQLLPAFRGAIAEKAGLENNLFHNHLTGETPAQRHAHEEAQPHTRVFHSSGYIHRYPLIQYRIHAGKAGIVGYAEGADALAQFLAQYDGRLKMTGHDRPLRIRDYQRTQSTAAIVQGTTRHHLWNWLPLNQHNHEQYLGLTRLADRTALLERILTNQLFALATGIGWHIQPRLDVFITRIHREKTLTVRGVRRLAFDIDWTSNLTLPPGMGIGKVVAEGYGRNVPG